MREPIMPGYVPDKSLQAPPKKAVRLIPNVGRLR
jgi:hypothetical protein